MSERQMQERLDMMFWKTHTLQGRSQCLDLRENRPRLYAREGTLWLAEYPPSEFCAVNKG